MVDDEILKYIYFTLAFTKTNILVVRNNLSTNTTFCGYEFQVHFIWFALVFSLTKNKFYILLLNNDTVT